MAHIPYEFLVRWNHQTGALQGAHVKLYDSVTQQEGHAQPVAVAGAIGFPLADVITALQAGSLISMEQAQAELAAHVATIATLQAEIAAANGSIATLAAAHEVTKAALAKAQAVI